MKQTSGPAKQPADAVVKDIRRATRRQISAEEKIRIVLDGLRGEESIAELCRRLAEVLPRISRQHEVILVNDGSRDRSWETIQPFKSWLKQMNKKN